MPRLGRSLPEPQAGVFTRYPGQKGFGSSEARPRVHSRTVAAFDAARLRVLRDEVDEGVQRLTERHGPGLRCARGCSGCCVDGIRVFEVEAAPIRHWVATHLPSAEPHGPGACAFLSEEGHCRIYPVRPYVCRTQGLPLRWEEPEEGAEYRDICGLNAPGVDVLALAPDDCWTLGPHEDRLRRLEAERLGRPPEPQDRVTLRDLFEAG